MRSMEQVQFSFRDPRRLPPKSLQVWNMKDGQMQFPWRRGAASTMVCRPVRLLNFLISGELRCAEMPAISSLLLLEMQRACDTRVNIHTYSQPGCPANVAQSFQNKGVPLIFPQPCLAVSVSDVVTVACVHSLTSTFAVMGCCYDVAVDCNSFSALYHHYFHSLKVHDNICKPEKLNYFIAKRTLF